MGLTENKIARSIWGSSRGQGCLPSVLHMFQGVVPHHDTGGFTSHRKFLADKEYGDALDCLVKACSDLLLTDGERIFLGKRRVQPQPDW